MTDKAIQIHPPDSATIEGIELFEQTVGHDPLETIDAVITDTDWTPEQAAKVLGKSVRTIRRLLQEGTLKGHKVPGKRRDEWRIKPVTATKFESVSVPLQKSITSENDRLWQLLKDKDSKIEALTMRTGYLEAQLESHKEQIKLLVDSQYKQAWWGRFSAWVKGVRG